MNSVGVALIIALAVTINGTALSAGDVDNGEHLARR